jgi:DNA-binding transcriptional ArsR family regulator
MLRIHFTSQDLARTTISPYADPLWECLLSLHLAQTGDGELAHGTWRRRVRPHLPRATRLLFELAPPRGYSPDFLTPNPGTRDLETGLDRLASTPAERVRAQLDQLTTRQRPTAWIRALAEVDRHRTARLADAIRAYHRRAIAPYWKAISDHVAGDHAYRTQVLARDGIGALFSTLNAGVRWDPPVLRILDFADTDLYLDGRGITLQPSLFCWRTPTKLRDCGDSPVLVYPIGGMPDVLHVRENRRTDRVLAALLGRTRATALKVTAEGSTTTDLAERCGISPAAASHQAAVLREAGLIRTERRGLSVWHEITPLGLNVLEGGTSGISTSVENLASSSERIAASS